MGTVYFTQLFIVMESDSKAATLKLSALDPHEEDMRPRSGSHFLGASLNVKRRSIIFKRGYLVKK